jgi:hypothetical protein
MNDLIVYNLDGSIFKKESDVAHLHMSEEWHCFPKNNSEDWKVAKGLNVAGMFWTYTYTSCMFDNEIKSGMYPEDNMSDITMRDIFGGKITTFKGVRKLCGPHHKEGFYVLQKTGECIHVKGILTW